MAHRTCGEPNKIELPAAHAVVQRLRADAHVAELIAAHAVVERLSCNRYTTWRRQFFEIKHGALYTTTRDAKVIALLRAATPPSP